MQALRARILYNWTRSFKYLCKKNARSVTLLILRKNAIQPCKPGLFSDAIVKITLLAAVGTSKVEC